MLHQIFLIVLLTLTVTVQAQTTHVTLMTTVTERATTLTSTIRTSTSTTILPSASSDPSWLDDSHFQAACLNSTNTYRAQHDTSTLQWNATLAKWASRWTSKCLWAHSGLGFGENLAEGFATVADAIDGWGNERRMFDFGNRQFTEQTGHFSQLVWRTSRSMGCSRTYCTTDDNPSQPLKVVARDGNEKAFGWFLACEFWPPGNVAGQFAENVHSQVSNGDTSHGLIAGGGASEEGVIGNSGLALRPGTLLLGSLTSAGLIVLF